MAIPRHAADNPLLGEEGEKQPVARWRRRTKWSYLKDCLDSFRAYALYSVLVLMVVCQSFLAWKLSHVTPITEPLGEVHGLIPNTYGPRTIKFTTTWEQGRLAMNETDPGWTDIMPVGSGFVVVKDWEKHQETLPPPMKTHGDDVFSVAVFHQLHCLHYMLKEFNVLYKESSAHSRRDGAHHGHGDHAHEGHGPGSEAYKHMSHCFDYLRSSLMCCGDSALEGQAAGLEEAGTLGVGSYHVCKNYDAIRTWAGTSRASNMEGFSD